MQDFVIDQVSWHRDGGSEPPEKTLVRFKAVVRFLQDRGLVKKTLLDSDENPTASFCIRASDLTDEGLELLKATYDRWLKSVDQGKTAPDNVSLFEKRLLQLRQE